MAGDWIKMRTSLLTNPKVNGIARELECSSQVSRALATGYNGHMSEIVTRNVMRHVTVSSLLVVWGAANEHTKDGVFTNADLSDIDDMVGIPGFGEAMEVVGWAVYDEESNSVTLPNFNEYNTSGQVRSAGAKTGAERQKEYRDRKKAQESDVTGDVTRDVTSDVTSNRREEKRREDIKPSSPKVDESAGFALFWKTWPSTDRKVAKSECAKKWRAKGLEANAAQIVAHVESQKKTKQWADGFEPAPLTYINQQRWLDGAPTLAVVDSRFKGAK